MNLFRLGEFTLHAGQAARWKIDCDALRDADWECLAAMAAEHLARRGVAFGGVEGVPTGGLKFAEAMMRYVDPGSTGILIVDDVLSTGASMESQRRGRVATGVVVFARGTWPWWVRPLFISMGD